MMGVWIFVFIMFGRVMKIWMAMIVISLMLMMMFHDDDDDDDNNIMAIVTIILVLLFFLSDVMLCVGLQLFFDSFNCI